MTINTRLTKIKILLRKYAGLFENLERDLNNIKVIGNSIYFPRVVSFESPDGAALINGLGYISFTEVISKSGEIDGYIYRFSSGEYTYLAECKSEHFESNDLHQTYFNFHYQDDPNHDPHVSFLHSGIRYISKSVNLDEFMLFVQTTFFKSTLERTTSLPWHSRIS